MKTTAFYTPPPSAVATARPAMAGSTLGGILGGNSMVILDFRRFFECNYGAFLGKFVYVAL